MRFFTAQKYRIILTTLVTAFFMLCHCGDLYAAVGMVPPQYPALRFQVPEKKAGLSMTRLDSPALMVPEYDLLKYEFKVDSALTYCVGKSAVKMPFFAPPVVISFEEFKSNRMKKDIRKQWLDSVKQLVFKKAGTSGAGALQIEIPWRVRSKTFQKIFGGDKVGLKVTGDITINGGLRKQKTNQSLTTQNDANNYSFRIDQTQRFNIEGKVGDKVSVFIDQDSERMFDFENALKLEYTGDEDEIIQKIEAGNVSLTLTGTQLATFSGTNKGLFGLKTESRFGPLKMTTIASVEKGQKNKKSLTGGAEEQTTTYDSDNYVRNKYFFLNDAARENYRHFNANMEREALSNTYRIKDIQVFKHEPGLNLTQYPDAYYGWAMYVITDTIPTQENPPLIYHRYFRRLEENQDYIVNRELGYIRLQYSLNIDDVLAVTYRTESGNEVGTIEVAGNSQDMRFQLLRPENPQPSQPTWNWEFHNVYSLSSSAIDQEGFKLEIKRNIAGANPPSTQLVQGQPKTFLEIFGLDNRNNNNASQATPDGLIDNNPEIFNWSRGEIIFPDPRPFDPDSSHGGGYFKRDATGVFKYMKSELDSTTFDPLLYDTSATYNFTPQYKLYATMKSAAASYSLGFNVLEGSEEVYLNGKKLTKGSGYQIDYMTGNLTILDQSASASTANVEVFWESGEIFQLDKKTLLGIRGEYELWNSESFVGGTALYLNEKPLEERVKLGNEPIRNFIVDANTKMVFKPDFLTEAIDFLPLIEAEEKSEIKFEAEAARIYPNPNPLNNPATGDNNGVAYLDDFESIKRVTSLGIMRRNWTMSSTPSNAVSLIEDDGSLLNRMKRNYVRGRLIWYNPFKPVSIQEIWPAQEVNAQVPQTVNVLAMEFTPGGFTETGVTPEQSWGGVQRYLSSGYANQTEAKYLEIWVDPSKAYGLNLHIDLGKVSEDIIPNNTLDTEDDPITEASDIGDGICDEDEDKGLDRLDGTDDYWDINQNGLKDEFEPYSNDNYSNQSQSNNYSQINGTEGNREDEGERIPDTEDLNGNVALDLTESFFRCTIPMPIPDSLDAGNDQQSSWHLIRFPLKYAEAINSPSWDQIQFARIWVDGLPNVDTSIVRIATIELVSNEWEEIIVTDAGGTPHERLEISVINTIDNPNDYQGNQPPGVRGVRDPITKIMSKEQSLNVKVIDLAPQGTVQLHKTFNTYQDFMKYNKLKMFVYGDEGYTDVISDSSLKVFFRFGSDTSQNYYEIYQTIKEGWHEDNEIELDLTEIPRIKAERDNLLNIDPNLPYETELGYNIVNGDTAWFGYQLQNGDSLIVRGNPSLSQIRQLTIGIVNMSKEHIYSGDEVYLWFDELRLSDVKKDPGTAYRSSLDIKFSDLGSMHLESREEEAGYYSLNERLDNPGTASGSSSKKISGTIQMDKFLPPSWGLRLPVNGNYSNDITTPKYYPGSDLELDTGDPLAVDTVQALQNRRGWGISFSRSGAAGGKVLEYTVNKVSASYDYSQAENTSPTYEYNNSNSESARLSYNLPLPYEKLGIKYMSWAGNIPLLKKLKDSKFQPMITKIETSVSGTQTSSNSFTRSQVYSENSTFAVTRTFNTGWKPFGPMNFDFGRTHRSDMQGFDWIDLTSGQFGKENNIQQNFNSSYNPVIFKWMSQDISYSSNYTWNWGSGYAISGKSISNRTSINGSVTLKISQIFKGKDSKGGRNPGGRTPPRRGGDQVKEGEGKKEGEPAKDKPNYWALFSSTLSKLNDIRIDYSTSRDLSMPAVTGGADWKYQLGFSKKPGVSQVPGYAGTSIGSESYSDKYSVKSGLNLMKNLKTTFDHSINTTDNYQGTNRTGSIKQTQVYIVNKKNGIVRHYPFINITNRLTGLEKLSLFQKYTQSVSLESGYSGSASTNWQDSPSDIQKRDYERGFNPLVGLNISWKGGISSNFQLKKTQTFTDNFQADSKNINNTTTLTVTANYNRKTGFKIPLPVWPFKNKRFENNTTISLTFSLTSKNSENKLPDNDKFIEMERNLQWSLKPALDYTFSNTVTGGLHYEMGATNDKSGSKTSFNEIGFNVRISIRGK